MTTLSLSWLQRAVGVGFLAVSMSGLVGAAPHSLPRGLADWTMPVVCVEGVQTFVNNETKTRRVYQVRSWYFGNEEVHVLDGTEPGKTMRVVMHHGDDAGQLTAWSKGDDEGLGQTLMRNRRSRGTLSQFSPLNTLCWTMEALQGRKQYTMAEVLTSPEGRDCTATLRLEGVAKGVSFRDDSLKVVAFENGVLRSVLTYVQGNDTSSSTTFEPTLSGTSEYSGHSASFPQLPRQIRQTLRFPYDRVAFEIAWDIERIAPIPPGVSAQQVIREMTAGLFKDRWPARAQQVTASRYFGRWGGLGWAVRGGVVVVLVCGVLLWLRRARRVAR